MFRELSIQAELYKNYKVHGGDEKKLANLSKVNIFIGANNTGKSRFLRNIFSQEDHEMIPPNISLNKINSIISEHTSKIIGLLSRSDINNIKTIIDGIKPITFFQKKTSTHTAILKSLDEIIQSKIYTPSHVNLPPQEAQKTLSRIAESVKEFREKLINQNLNNLDLNYNSIYIPVLRGLRPMQIKSLHEFDNDVDNYLKRTKRDYFFHNNNTSDPIEKKIFTGLNLYTETKKLLLGKREDREKIRKFEEFLSKSFFQDKIVNLIPSISDDVIHFRIEDEEHPIFELGDGIQSIIALTYPLFFNSDKQLIAFIEEPENYLHPGMQRIFLDTLLSEQFDNFQFFITTHSNHFLDITLETDNISVYTFKKVKEDPLNPEYEIENVDNDNSNILGLLGVRNSSVFLSNCTIWVEGITDRMYIRRFLEIIQLEKNTKYKEDLNYSFVEYGGGNITHWSFLQEESEEPIKQTIEVERLCSKLFLISDNDGAGKEIDGNVSKEAKKRRHEKLKATLKERYHCIDAQEIENILHHEVVKNIISEYEKTPKDQIKFKSSFTYEAYQKQYLGKFIDDNLVSKNREGNYGSKSGTITDKVEFCKRSLKYIKTKEDLTPEAITLSEKIYSFIAKNNR